MTISYSPTFGIIVSALAIDNTIERFEKLDLYGDQIVRGCGSAIHTDALELYPVFDAVFLAVAALPHKPIGYGHGRVIHYYHTGLILNRV